MHLQHSQMSRVIKTRYVNLEYRNRMKKKLTLGDHFAQENEINGRENNTWRHAV